MSAKMKTIKLMRAINMDKSEVGKPVYHYLVSQITDSLDFHVKDYITEAQAKELCEAEDWKVTIT